MLDSRHLLDEASLLMSQHVMQGRGVVEVIDELEIIFSRKYEELASSNNNLVEESKERC